MSDGLKEAPDHLGRDVRIREKTGKKVPTLILAEQKLRGVIGCRRDSRQRERCCPITYRLLDAVAHGALFAGSRGPSRCLRHLQIFPPVNRSATGAVK